MTKEQVVRLFGRSIEFDAPQERENFRILRDAGASAYPAMAEVLLSSSDPDAIRNIIPIFVQSEGDKTIPLRAMTQFVDLHINDDPINQEINSVIRGIGELGGGREAAFLNKLSRPEDPLVRNSIEYNIGKIEKRLAAESRRTTSIEKRGQRDIDGSLHDSRFQSELKSESPIFSNMLPFQWQFGVGMIVVLIFGAFYFLRKRIG